MWLDNLKELKKEKGMSSKQIAEMTNLPEHTVIRIFSGDTDNPYVAQNVLPCKFLADQWPSKYCEVNLKQ